MVLCKVSRWDNNQELFYFLLLRAVVAKWGEPGGLGRVFPGLPGKHARGQYGGLVELENCSVLSGKRLIKMLIRNIVIGEEASNVVLLHGKLDGSVV